MIGLTFLFKRKRTKPEEMPASPAPQPVAPQQKLDKPSRFLGGAPERTQDFLGRQDGERVGFRKPVQG